MLVEGNYSADPASVIEGLKNVTTNQSLIAHFTCIMEGIPCPSIAWFRAIPPDNTFTIISNRDRFNISNKTECNQNRISTTLEVHSLVREEDEGYYQCLAVNNVTNLIQTSNSSVAFLTVQGK